MPLVAEYGANLKQRVGSSVPSARLGFAPPPGSAV